VKWEWYDAREKWPAAKESWRRLIRGIGSTKSSLGERLDVKAAGEGKVNRVEKNFAIRYPPQIWPRR